MYEILSYIIGCLIFSIGLLFFISPNKITSGGFTGLATLLNFATKIPISLLIIILNIPVIIISFIKIGSSLIIKSAIVTLIFSIEISLLEPFVPEYKTDTLLASIFGGVLIGIGIGIVVFKGATTGGVDILAKIILKKYPHLTFGKIILSFDFLVIFLSGFVYKNIESVLYSLITIYVSSRVMDIIVYGNDKGKIVYIFSKENNEIANKIMFDMKRGITKVNVFGGYKNEERIMLICTVRPHELSKLYSIVREKDEKAFIILGSADQIIGEGFKNF